MSGIKEHLRDIEENPCDYEIWEATKDIEIKDYEDDKLEEWDGIPCDLLN